MLGRSKFGFGLFAPRSFQKGEIIYEYEEEIVQEDARFLWIIDGKEYILEPPKHMCRCEGGYEYTGLDSFINHSCRPNARYEGKKLISLRPIKEGEELFVHYDTIDWIEENPYPCECGSKKCLGMRRGFKFLPPKIQKTFLEKNWLSSYVLKQYRIYLNSK